MLTQFIVFKIKSWQPFCNWANQRDKALIYLNWEDQGDSAETLLRLCWDSVLALAQILKIQNDCMTMAQFICKIL